MLFVFTFACHSAFTFVGQLHYSSQPKNSRGNKMFNFRRTTLFCLGYRLSKNKMTMF